MNVKGAGEVKIKKNVKLATLRPRWAVTAALKDPTACSIILVERLFWALSVLEAWKRLWFD